MVPFPYVSPPKYLFPIPCVLHAPLISLLLLRRKYGPFPLCLSINISLPYSMRATRPTHLPSTSTTSVWSLSLTSPHRNISPVSHACHTPHSSTYSTHRLYKPQMKIHFNIILPSTSTTSVWSLSLTSPHRNISPVSHACHTAHSSTYSAHGLYKPQMKIHKFHFCLKPHSR